MYSTVINILANLSEIQPSRFDVDITTLGDDDDRRGKKHFWVFSGIVSINEKLTLFTKEIDQKIDSSSYLGSRPIATRDTYHR